MSWQGGILTVLSMFVIRIALPLVVTFAISYALRKLDARWQAQENSWAA